MRPTLAALLVLVLLGAPASADVVELKDGRRFEGKFKGASSAIVAIDVGGRTVTFEFDDVRALYFGAPPPVPATAVTPSPAPAPAPEARNALPAPTVGSDASAALAALQALQAAVGAGVSYREYAPRVIETRATVQIFVQNPASGESGLKAVMNAAMSLYTLAVEAWSARIRKAGYEALAVNPAADLCPALRAKMLAAREQGLLKPTPLSAGIGVAAGLPQIWSCAGEKVDEAARLMTPPAK